MRKSDLIIESLREVNEATDFKSLNKKLQKFDKMADKATLVFDTAIKDAGYKLENMHLLNYDEWSKFQDNLERMLQTYGIDLSYREEYSSKYYKVSLGGNAHSICRDFLHNLINKYWEKVEWSRQEIINHLNKHPKAKVYKADPYGNVELLNRDKLLGSEFGSSYQDMGYGSQASTIETRVELYKDKFGNLKLSRHSITWD